MCGFLGKVNPESTSDSVVRLLWWQVLKTGSVNFLVLHLKWLVLVRFCTVHIRTVCVTQKLRQLIAFAVWLPGQRWWDVGLWLRRPSLREGRGPDRPRLRPDGSVWPQKPLQKWESCIRRRGSSRFFGSVSVAVCAPGCRARAPEVQCLGSGAIGPGCWGAGSVVMASDLVAP